MGLALWRRAMNASSVLPAGYTKLSGIRRKNVVNNAGGFAVIACAVNVSNVKKIVADMRIIELDNNCYVSPSAPPMGKFTVTINDSPETTWNGVNATVSINNMVGNEYKVVELTHTKSRTAGNESYTYTTLFGWRTQAVWTPTIAFRNIKVFNWSDKLVAEFIPCRENSSGFIGYYERCEGIFRTSAYPINVVENCVWEEDVIVSI